MNRVGELLISTKATVVEAMKQLDETAKQILFVVDDNRKLKYSLTDGDIRRFLLAGGSLSDNICLAAHADIVVAETIDEAKSVFDINYCFAVPILDLEGRIVDIYFGERENKRTRKNLDIPVVINAGGKGTRLDPFTRVLPKPLIPVGDLPIIEHIMREYKSFGCNDFHVIINYKKQLIRSYFTEADNDYKLSFYDEEEPLGTGGGLCYIKGVIDRTFFFSNCDNLLRADYGDILEYHRDHNNVITMICAQKHLTIPYGVVEIDETGRIETMQEKPEFTFLTNTGIYIVEPIVLDDIDNLKPIGFPDVIEKQISKGRKVSVFPVEESQWMDMGQMTELDKMRKRLYGE